MNNASEVLAVIFEWSSLCSYFNRWAQRFLVGMSLSVLLWGLQTLEALYGYSFDVLLLTPSIFESKVTNSDGVVFVEFFAPWRGHYRTLIPIWEKIAAILKGFVIIAVFDADGHRNMKPLLQIPSMYFLIRIWP